MGGYVTLHALISSGLSHCEGHSSEPREADCVTEAADVCRRQTSASRVPFIAVASAMAGARLSVPHLFSPPRRLAEHRRWSGSLKRAHVPPQGDVSPHLPLQPPPPRAQQQGPVVDHLQAPYLMCWTVSRAALRHFSAPLREIL